MGMLRQRDLITFISCICLSSFAMAKMQKSVKPLHIPLTALIKVDTESFFSPGLVFGGCPTLDPQGNCTFYLETKELIDSKNHLKTCNVSRKSIGGRIGDFEGIWGFGDDKAIMRWWDEDYQSRFAILHFSTCKYYVVGKDLVKYRYMDIPYVIPSIDSFSIVTPGDEESTCENEKYCKLTLDDKGRVITTLLPWGTHEFHDGDIVDIIYSPLRENLIVKSFENEVRLISTTHDKSQVLRSLTDKGFVGRKTIVTSKTEKLLTICYPNARRTLVLCGQFDWNGNLKFETKIHKRTSWDSSLAVFNLPGGGFILADNRCTIEDIHDCERDYQSCFSTELIDLKGKSLGCNKITCEMQYGFGLELKNVHFHINKNGRYCFSEPDIFPKNLTVSLHTICLDKDDSYAKTCRF